MEWSAQISKAILPSSGTYFIMASSYETLNGLGGIEEVANDSVEFEMTINGVTPPTDIEGFDPAHYTYFTGTIGMNETVEGYSTVQEPIYYYVFDAVEGETLNLSLESEEFDTVMHLFGPGGDRLAVNDDADDSTYNSAFTNFTVPATGRYLIFATSYYFVDAPLGADSFLGGDFTLSMTNSK